MPRALFQSPTSLRWQLTVWIGLALGLVVALLVLAIYGLLARNLSRQVDDSLKNRANQVESAIQRRSPFSAGAPLEEVLPNTFASTDIFVQVADIDGEVLGTSDNLDEAMLPITPESLAAIQEGKGAYAKVWFQGERLRTYIAPLTLPEHPISAVQVARSLEPREAALAQLRLLGAVGLLVAVFVAGLVVWLLTGRALSPLEQVIETSEVIGLSSDLSNRVRTGHTVNEVGRLANTLNRMLERLERSDRELREANEKLAASLRAQRRFTADASHELRTPLTTIRGYASLLRQFAQVTPEDRIAAVAQIDHEAERMSRLVEDLLTLARADSGLTLSRERVPLAPLVEDVAEQTRTLDEGRHDLYLHIDEPLEVIGDQDTLRQLLLILMDNAMKYTPDGGRIDLRLGSEEGQASIEVADDGIGISQDALPHIFERFHRAHRDRKVSKGTGLGLAIARWIVGEHGGVIEVRSNDGRGSSFTVRLPLAPPAPSVEQLHPETLTAS